MQTSHPGCSCFGAAPCMPDISRAEGGSGVTGLASAPGCASADLELSSACRLLLLIFWAWQELPSPAGAAAAPFAGPTAAPQRQAADGYPTDSASEPAGQANAPADPAEALARLQTLQVPAPRLCEHRMALFWLIGAVCRLMQSLSATQRCRRVLCRYVTGLQ